MENKPLSELCNQPPLMVFEDFVIRPFDGHTLWFEHPSGEGTQLRRDVFLGVLIKLFKETF